MKHTYIEKARVVHNDKYDYSLISDLPKRDTRVEIICPNHGVFEQSFHKHLCGDGCRKCAHERIGKNRIEQAKNKFKQEASLIHNNKYDYSKVDYISATDKIIINSSTKVTILCKDHGEFKVTPNNHLRYRGCPKCSHSYSKASINWLEYMEVKYDTKIQHALNGGDFSIPSTLYRADGYSNKTNTIFEFHGDFWHGNLKIYQREDINPFNGLTYGELYDKTKSRTDLLISKGYNVVEIWECDWDMFIKCIKTLQKKWKCKNNENS